MSSFYLCCRACEVEVIILRSNFKSISLFRGKIIPVICKKFGLFRLKEILVCFKYLVERVYLNLVYPDIEFHSGHILSLLFCLFQHTISTGFSPVATA